MGAVSETVPAVPQKTDVLVPLLQVVSAVPEPDHQLPSDVFQLPVLPNPVPTVTLLLVPSASLSQ